MDYKDVKLKSVNKTESTRDYKKLKLQEEFLDKNLSSTIKGLKIDADLIRQFIEDRLKTAAQRQPKLREIETSIVEIFQELKRLKSMLQKSDPSSIKNLDVKEYGSRLKRLSKKMEDFKSFKSYLNILSKEEESLDFDIREFERSIFITERIKPLNKTVLPIDRKYKTRSDINDQFTELISRTGHTQGWSDDDHYIFLKIRSKFESVPRIVIEIRKKRPHLTNEEIINHETWYKLYTELKDKRKKEIVEWRSKNNSNDNCNPISDLCVINNKKNRIVINNKRKINGNKKKIMIEEWKADRLRKSVMDEEQKLRLEKAKIEKEKRKRDAKRSEAKIKMKNYREERRAKSLDDERIQISRINEKKNQRDSLRLIKSFREQDERFLRKRLSRLKMSEKMSNKFEESDIINYNNKRENSTLLKPTKVWEEKCKINSKIDEADNLFKRVNYVKDIQRLQSQHRIK